MAAVDGGNLAYVTTRPAVGGPPQELEFRVHAYRPSRVVGKARSNILIAWPQAETATGLRSALR